MLDHVFLSVSDIERSIAFYNQALAPLGITDRVDYDGKDGPPGHPDLKGLRPQGAHLLLVAEGRGRRPVGACRLRGRLGS
jgi:catechol 2,3-dioxygenase-like lactoylglutathione lyase family enzyme